jgi:hypothetical protein
MPYVLLSRIRAEYLEMPGLRLTVPQAHRLCGGEEASCQAVLDRLVEERFLSRRPDGTYARLTDGPRLRPS